MGRLFPPSTTTASSTTTTTTTTTTNNRNHRSASTSTESSTTASRTFLDIPPVANGSYHRPQLLPAVPPLRLTTSREDSTRVQLQRQRLSDEQRHASSVAAAVVVSKRIPGFQTSAAFFASLRTNLRLNASPPGSPVSTPPSMTASTGSLPPPSPLSFVTDYTMDPPAEGGGSNVPEDPMAGVPELQSYATTDEAERADALNLIADGVAEMRGKSNSALLYHPATLAVALGTLVLAARYLVEVQQRTLTVTGVTCTGLTIMLVVLCRWLTQPYDDAAAAINWEWLGDGDVYVTKFGDEVIAAIVVDWIAVGESRQKRKKPQRGEIKAWSTRLKYRRKAVGAALLETVVQESRRKGADTVVFADHHANSVRVLPSLFNREFDRNDARARELLQDLLAASPSRSKRK